MLIRHDRSPLNQTIKLDNGFLKVPITATRTGIFVYKKPDGGSFKELRLPNEVFNDDSMDSLRGVPITNRHPTEMINSKNAKELTKGFSSDMVTRNDDKLETHATITHEDLIQELEANTSLREVSCGYELNLDFTPGVYKGERYDAVQRNIRYNHIAVVDKGRAGSSSRIHMDGDELEFDRVINLDSLEDDCMKTKIKIKGVEYEVSESAAQAIQSRIDSLEASATSQDKDLSGLREDATKKQAKIDALEADLENAKESKLDDEKIRSIVNARVALVKTAAAFCKDSIEDVDKKSDRDLMIAIIKSESEKFDAEGKEDSYLQARVDHMVESGKKPEETQTNEDGIGTAVGGKPKPSEVTADPKSYSERRDAYKSASEESWSKPLSMSKKKA